MWLLDIRWWGIYALFLGLGALGGEIHGRTAGAAKVTAEWAADTAARIQRTSEIILEQVRLRDVLSERLRKSTDFYEKRDAEVLRRLSVALGTAGRERVPDSVVGVFNESTTRMRDNASAGEVDGKAEGPAAVSASPAAISFAQLTERAVSNNALHLQCVAQVEGWQEWYEGLRKTNERKLE